MPDGVIDRGLPPPIPDTDTNAAAARHDDVQHRVQARAGPAGGEPRAPPALRGHVQGSHGQGGRRLGARARPGPAVASGPALCAATEAGRLELSALRPRGNATPQNAFAGKGRNAALRYSRHAPYVLHVLQELEVVWRQLDTSHAREQELQELVDDLRRQVNKLNMDLEQKTRLGLDQGDE